MVCSFGSHDSKLSMLLFVYFLSSPMMITAAFLQSLNNRTEEEALSQLLSHLLLLNPGNSEARAEYMKLLPKVMPGLSEEMEYRDMCRQLLSLAMVHPAFPHEDREALTYWLSQLDSKHKNMAPSPSLSSTTQQPVAQQPPALPSRSIRQVHTTEETNLSAGNGRIYIEGELSHSSLTSHPHHHDQPPSSSDPYSPDDVEVQRTLASSKIFESSQSSQALHIEPSLPEAVGYDEGGAGLVRDKASTVPRVGMKEETVDKDPGMRGED